jgi:hypothetical protein
MSGAFLLLTRGFTPPPGYTLVGSVPLPSNSENNWNERWIDLYVKN